MFEMVKEEDPGEREDKEYGLKLFLIKDENGRSTPKYMKKGEWSILQISKYAVFIEQNKGEMENKEPKELWGKFEQMSEFIRSRNYRQCKLYHQRMQNQFKTIPQIICQLNRIFPDFYQYFQEQKRQVQTIKNNEQIISHSLRHAPNEIKREGKELFPTGISYERQITSPYSQLMDKFRKPQKIVQQSPYLLGRFSNQKEQEEIMERDFRECHEYFVRWIQKYNQMISYYPHAF